MENIIKFIEGNAVKIIANIDFESVEVYNFLKEQFENSNVNENHLFQFVYRSFYRLDNAGLTPEFKTEYFKILQESRNNYLFDFESVLKRLFLFPNRKGQNSFQFSFTTKMLSNYSGFFTD